MKRQRGILHASLLSRQANRRKPMKSWTTALALYLFLAGMSASFAQGPEKPRGMYNFRYGYEVNERLYLQKTPKDAIASVVKTLSDERVDYLLAHLAYPGFVDAKVAVYMRDYAAGDERGKALLAFQRLVRETTKFYYEDAELL